jgi:hypothetical protein
MRISQMLWGALLVAGVVYLVGANAPSDLSGEGNDVVGGQCSWFGGTTNTAQCPGGCDSVSYHIEPPPGYGYDWNSLQGICGSASGCIDYRDWQNNGTENCEPGGP